MRQLVNYTNTVSQGKDRALRTAQESRARLPGQLESVSGYGLQGRQSIVRDC